MKRISHTALYIYILLAAFLVFSPEKMRAQADLLPNDTSQNAGQAQETVWPPDSLGRRNPRGTIEGFIAAVADENYTKAGMYLRLDSALKKNQNKEELARSLQQLLDKDGNILPYPMISEDASGVLDDNLGPNLEKIGTASINSEDFDLILERTEGPDGGPVWLFSSETIQRVPILVEKAPIAPLIDKLSPKSLEGKKWGGVPVAHWFGAICLLIITYFVAWGITNFILLLIPYGYRKAKTEPTFGIIKAFALPIRLYITIWLFTIAMQEAGISIILRQRFSSLTVMVAIVAVMLLFWQLLEVITRFFERRLVHHGNQAGVSAILFLRRSAKVALIILGIILILDNFGFDVTTGLAALGIGGIALALGAQKTMENFVGSVTLIADQPVRVGDFCKVGDVMGTVEQIGMRSTRIRTLDRTIVTIPNGEFSSQKIENFAHRDRFWFHPIFNLRIETTTDQIRYLLVELRSILYAHPKVDPSPARVRFIEIGTEALKLEVFAFINTLNGDEYLEIQEDLYLRMMDVITASGTGLAMPSQRLYITRDPGVSAERTAEAGEQVKRWRETGDMQLPNFSSERIDSLRNTIPYPPEGSVFKNNS